MHGPSRLRLLLCVLYILPLAVALASCAAPTPMPPAGTATLTPSAPPTATAVPEPTATATPAPTPVPSEVPEGGVAVYFGDVRFAAMVADTPALRSQGLSGHPGLADDEGMWFDFGQLVSTSFWMREMLFPLDMVWIDNNLTVVAVSHDVPVPAPGTPERELPTYDSGGIPIRYVLEINAGLAERHGIGPGVQVRLAEE